MMKWKTTARFAFARCIISHAYINGVCVSQMKYEKRRSPMDPWKHDETTYNIVGTRKAYQVTTESEVPAMVERFIKKNPLTLNIPAKQ